MQVCAESRTSGEDRQGFAGDQGLLVEFLKKCVLCQSEQILEAFKETLVFLGRVWWRVIIV